tara:strand:+ start:1314 stop:1559 length:246 start_codon:yes stop_codon:yes gene_type:complete
MLLLLPAWLPSAGAVMPSAGKAAVLLLGGGAAAGAVAEAAFSWVGVAALSCSRRLLSASCASSAAFFSSGSKGSRHIAQLA